MLPRFLLRMVGKVVRRPVLRHLAAFKAATDRPDDVQEQLLRNIIRRHADTAFGRDHGFREIRDTAQWRRRVPIAGYEYIEPYINRVRAGEVDALLADERVHMFALTSGTTAARKFIPVTDRYLADYRRGWNIWGMQVFLDHPEVKLRPIAQLSGDWDEFRTDAGIPCGSVTGLTARTQKRIMRWLYCVPACVGRVKDPLAKYYLALRLSVPLNIGLIFAANPSTLLNLARTGDQEKENLIRDISDGTLSPRYAIPTEIRSELGRQLARRFPERARQLEAIVDRTSNLYPKDYWPRDCLSGNWTGGSAGAYLRQFPRYFGSTPIRDVGLIASEGRMTIPLTDGTPSGVLDVTTHYYEFIPEAEIESSQPTVLTACELQEGRNYFILPTTAAGLYRYDIHDLVRVTGFYKRTPLVEFLSKGANFSSLTGEKVSEYQVIEAMTGTLARLGLFVSTYSVAPCWDDETPYYGLFVERSEAGGQAAELAHEFDDRLAKANMEYASKRESRRLGPVRTILLPAGGWLRWDRERLMRTGGTPEQYKHPCLIPDPEFHRTLQEAPVAGTSAPLAR